MHIPLRNRREVLQILLLRRCEHDIHAAIDYRATGGGNDVSGTTANDGTYEIDGDQIYISSGDGGSVGSFRNGVITLKLDLMGKGDARTYTFRYVP